MKNFRKESVVGFYKNQGKGEFYFARKAVFNENVSNLKKIVHGLRVLQLILLCFLISGITSLQKSRVVPEKVTMCKQPYFKKNISPTQTHKKFHISQIRKKHWTTFCRSVCFIFESQITHLSLNPTFLSNLPADCAGINNLMSIRNMNAYFQ